MLYVSPLTFEVYLVEKNLIYSIRGERELVDLGGKSYLNSMIYVGKF